MGAALPKRGSYPNSLLQQSALRSTGAIWQRHILELRSRRESSGRQSELRMLQSPDHLVLNPNAWTDAPGGTFGVSAPFYNNVRWQRQPAEAMSFGRNFRVGKEGQYNLSVRAEFQNIFNRLFLSMPASGTAIGSATAAANPATPTTTAGGVYTGGYGFIATVGGAGAQPRSGQIVARFTF
jgi:hypothetical protein